MTMWEDVLGAIVAAGIILAIFVAGIAVVAAILDTIRNSWQY